MTVEQVTVQAVVQWPRRAEAHGRYLLVADVTLGEPGEWPYAREEFVIGCVLEGGDAFQVEALGSTGLVLHRFGGTYGPVRFMVHADRNPRADGSDALRLTLVTEGGIPFQTMSLQVLPKAAAADGTDQLDVETTRWIEQPAPPRPRPPQRLAGNRPAAKLTPREPRRSALLIGAPTPGSSGGTHNDVAAMAEVLSTHYGFDHYWVRTGANTTRAGILDAYEELIADTVPDDVIVIYLSGYSGLPRRPPGEISDDSGFLLTTDQPPTGPSADHVTVTGVELDSFHRRLTETTGNLTVIYDINGAIQRRPPGQPADPLLVQVYACGANEQAYEIRGRDGVARGVFTEALAQVLTEAAGLRITWATLVDQIRRRVLRQMPSQRPKVVGPARRVLFDTAEVRDESTLPIIPLDETGRAQILGAPLLNVQVGDEFVILPAGAAGPDDQPVLGTAVVDHLAQLVALARAEFAPPTTSIPIGARAYRTRAMAERLGIRLPPFDEPIQALFDAVASSTMLRPAHDDSAYEVRIDEKGWLTIHDRIGPLSDPVPAAGGTARVIADLERLARAAALRRLADDQIGAMEPAIVDFGQVIDGELVPLGTADPLLYTGDRVYIALRNDSDQPIYVSLVDIGIAAQVTVLTSSFPSGVQLGPGSEYFLGGGRTGATRGVEITWPTHLDPAGPRIETILVITTAEPQDLSPLEQRGVRSHVRESPLQQVLAQANYGTSRSTGSLGDNRPAGYALRSFTLRVNAAPRPDSGGPYTTYLTPPELRKLCLDVRTRVVHSVDGDLVEAIEENVATYRRRWTTLDQAEPPDDLREHLSLMGWLIYETSLSRLLNVPAGYDPDTDEGARRAVTSIERLANAARKLPWPEYAPRSLGALRAEALMQSKRDTSEGYDAAWVLLHEAFDRLRTITDATPFELAAWEIDLQLSLSIVGTAYRMVERTVTRWDEVAPSQADDRTTAARLIRHLTSASETGERALDTASKIQRVAGFADQVDENRLALPTTHRNPALMLCRALLLLTTLQDTESLARSRSDLRVRFDRAFAYLVRPVYGTDGEPWPLARHHVRSAAQLLLHLAMIDPGYRLSDPIAIEGRAIDRLDEDAVEFLSAWLAEFVDGRQRGDAGVIGNATWPHFIAQVEALSAVSGTPIDYRAWRRRWFVLDRYAATVGRRERLTEILGPVD